MLTVAVCGIDGAGKTTLLEILNELILSMDIPILCTKAPFPSKEICTMMKWNDCQLAKEVVKRSGMAFDFATHYLTIVSFDGILLCDRYDVDYEVLNEVYNLPQEIRISLCEIYRVAPPIDLYIYLKISSELAAARLEERGDRAIDESDSVLKSMERIYDKHFQMYTNKLIIDAEQAQDIITQVAKSKIIELWEVSHDR